MFLSDTQRLNEARGLVEELLALPYTALLQNYGQLEQEQARVWILERLQKLLGAQSTCASCGAKFYAGQLHTCDEPQWTPDPEFNLYWNEE
jgi:hypothetical protein